MTLDRKKKTFDEVLDTIIEDPFAWVTKSIYTKTSDVVVKESRYRSRSDEKTMVIEVDLPGVNPRSVTLTAIDGKFIIAYEKGEKKFTEKYTINDDFDVKTAIAVIEHCQLIITLYKSAMNVPKNIPITIR